MLPAPQPPPPDDASRSAFTDFMGLRREMSTLRAENDRLRRASVSSVSNSSVDGHGGSDGGSGAAAAAATAIRAAAAANVAASVTSPPPPPPPPLPPPPPMPQIGSCLGNRPSAPQQRAVAAWQQQQKGRPLQAQQPLLEHAGAASQQQCQPPALNGALLPVANPAAASGPWRKASASGAGGGGPRGQLAHYENAHTSAAHLSGSLAVSRRAERRGVG